MSGRRWHAPTRSSDPSYLSYRCRQVRQVRGTRYRGSSFSMSGRRWHAPARSSDPSYLSYPWYRSSRCGTVLVSKFHGVETLPFDESAGFTAPSAFGTYRVLHQIGSGVLGPVFRTYDPQRDRLVAIKAFRLELLPEQVARLADALRRLTGEASPKAPAIVPALDAGLEGTTAFLAMEYVAAETLDVAIRHLAPAPIERALPIITQLADAIDAGWAAGVGHGALHPRDVFVT